MENNNGKSTEKIITSSNMSASGVDSLTEQLNQTVDAILKTATMAPKFL